MQIRIANRQDEKGIRELVGEPDAKDLRNIEAYYFGSGGLVVVLEEDEEIKAMIMARVDGQVMRIERLVGSDEASGRLRELYDIASNHAYQLDIDKIELADDLAESLSLV